jgi:S1-C subfamily serine protease
MVVGVLANLPTLPRLMSGGNVLVGRTACVAALILLAACFQNSSFDPTQGLAAPLTSDVIPLGSKGSYSVVFQGVLFRIPSGTLLGEVRIGNRVVDEMRWTRAESQTTEFNVGITDRLRERGYLMKDRSDAIFHPRRAVKTRYEMAAVLHRVEVDFEYKRSARPDAVGEGVGMATVRVEVQLHDAVLKETVYSKSFVGHGKDEGRKPTPIVPAVVDAVAQVATDPDFVKLVSKDMYTAHGTEGTREVAVVTACSPDDSISLPADLPEVLESVVEIQIGRSIGSGVIVSPDGYLLTAAHVIGDAKEAWVRTTRGPQLPATLIRSSSRLDVALLRVEGREHSCSAVRSIESDLELGRGVFGINISLGDRGTPTVTRGVVSGYADLQNRHLIQTDVAANPGSSGGPLIDDAGRVVGITVEKIVREGFEGLVFAVPTPIALDELGIEFRDDGLDRLLEDPQPPN